MKNFINNNFYKSLYLALFIGLLLFGASRTFADYTFEYESVTHTLNSLGCSIDWVASPSYYVCSHNPPTLGSVSFDLKSYEETAGVPNVLVLNWQTLTVGGTPPVVSGGGTTHSTAGIFFPVDNTTGLTTANNLTASVGNATGLTTDSLAPVVAVVGGIILAFMALRWVISLVYDTGYKQNKKYRV